MRSAWLLIFLTSGDFTRPKDKLSIHFLIFNLLIALLISEAMLSTFIAFLCYVLFNNVYSPEETKEIIRNKLLCTLDSPPKIH